MHTTQNIQHYGPLQYKHTTSEDIPQTLVNPLEARELAHLAPITSCDPSRSDTEVGIGRGRAQPGSLLIMTHDTSMSQEVQPHS